MNPTQPVGDGDPLRALDERIGLLVARLRDVVEERDALLREIDSLRDGAAELGSAVERSEAVNAAWRETAGQVGESLRSVLEELRAG